MEYSNETLASRFFLLSLADSPDLRALCAVTLLILYILILSVNSLLIVLVRLKLHLQTPMYFFLSNISAVDIGVPSSTLPKLMLITSSQDNSISAFGCAAQMFVLSALITTECTMLAIMAYDRYVAICKPLHYHTIMNMRVCIRSTQGRHKAFSTCASHLIVVSLYYGTLIFMYLLPRSKYFSETDKIMSITYTAVSPLLNPIIYSIRNTDIKLAIRGNQSKKDGRVISQSASA
ncbi:olfactory receptor 1038-like [Xenopus tropicalis]|uniref:Olfactory receptor 1038-like n=1 Tax=Xenopus tropicalis TaxID=8364 RepID=A0A8J1IYU4_XENTR|nr:olfactory receptor 1038-like [Xenopus tropicalis]